ncbi:MAG: Obg family GTPase CgtA [Myxococcota bacterium]
MRFIDEVTIRVQSGAGGNGCASFRREKFVPFGGPDGGDGGRGGDVALVATLRTNTLLELRGHAIWKARRGAHGSGSRKNGAWADAVEIRVPVGTRVFDAETGDVLMDLVEDGQRWVAAKGGKGGLGNIHFKSSTNRAPRKATPGQPGEERMLRLELMLMADVGLLGFPNAGKSTFISRVSAAKPRIAGYPFTTLTPNLGVVDMGVDGAFVIADIPGLVRGASDGVGLGLRFLKHVQRTKILLHLVSLGQEEVEAVVDRYAAIREELHKFDPELAKRDEVILLTKADLVSDRDAQAAVDALAAASEHRIFVASAVSGRGLRPIIGHLWQLLRGES